MWLSTLPPGLMPCVHVANVLLAAALCGSMGSQEQASIIVPV